MTEKKLVNGINLGKIVWRKLADKKILTSKLYRKVMQDMAQFRVEKRHEGKGTKYLYDFEKCLKALELIPEANDEFQNKTLQS